MGYNANVVLEHKGDGLYLVRGSLSYENHELIVTVTDGFLTDGASIPKYLWGIVGSPFEGLYTEAAVIHDGLYGSHRLTKKQSDNLFLEMMKSSGVSWHKRYLMYYAVKYFGGSSWNKPEKKIKKVKTFVEVRYENSIS